MKYVLVLDVAKGKSMFMLSSNVGEILIEPTELIHNKFNFDFIDSQINLLNIKDHLTVVMESTNVYHYSPMRFFINHNYHTIVFNPLIGKNCSNSIRKIKTDKLDCFKISDLFFKGYINDNFSFSNDIFQQLNDYSRQYFHLNDSLIRHKNRYKDLLHLCFPEFELCFKNSKIYELTALNFIYEFPHADIIANKRIDALAFNLAKTNGRHINYYKRKASLIKDLALNSFPGVSKDSNIVPNLQQLVSIIIYLTNQKNFLQDKIISLAKNTTFFDNIVSIFGIGDLSASLLIAELKDISRFHNVKQINAFCGFDPSIVQSGKSINFHGPISKRGNKYARRLLFNCSKNIISLSAKLNRDNPLFLYYLKKKQEGKHYYACLTACSTKLIRIIFALCINNSKQS